MNNEDIFLWPDGSWCYREDYNEGEYGWKSDDYMVLLFDSFDWHSIIDEV